MKSSTVKFVSILTLSTCYNLLLWSQQATAKDDGITSVRCIDSGDSLDAPQAIQRTKWARKCFPYLKGILGSDSEEAVKMRNTDGTIVPGYPTFAQVDDNGSIINYWKAPIDANASCEGATKYAIIGLCRAGCYTPDQLILFESGYLPIGSKEAKSETNLITLSPEATLENLTFKLSPLKGIVKDLVPHEQEVLVFHTEDHGEIKVTTNHPLIDGNGKIREAHSLKVGDQLIRSNGNKVAISEILKTKYYGKVYNVEVNSQISGLHQVVIAQDFLNGSIHYQNEGLKQLNRQLLRSSDLINKLLTHP